MQISGITGGTTGLNSVGSAGRSSGSGSFTDILSEALSNAADTEESAQEANASILTGEADDLHTPLIEAQKAELALDLAIQIRNKVITAYNQIMNMQV